MMRIQRFVSGFAVLAVISAACSAFGQSTITDQYGTEILVDVLPPQVQTQVQQTQLVLDSGGGEGPIDVDELGRFDLASAGGRGSSFGPSQDEYLVNQLLGVVLLPSPGEVR
ncbi:MAG: hypothetical protein CMO47_12835, partial [Verrucomicrobiales bacterium]|nr:hypothetical protein [Verrucomicrobiales bacterium]